MSIMNVTKTGRGFTLIEFSDRYGVLCSLQKSSLATEDAIWLGCSKPDPKILASETPEGGTGWVPYEIPEGVLCDTRMHLTIEQVAELIPILQKFVETGELE